MQCSKLRSPCKLIAAALLLVCGLAPALVFAQDSGNSEHAAIEIISVEHRDPLYVRSQINPLLDPRGSIGLVDNKLIIASTAGNLQQLKALIADTDVPARRLVVSVDFDFGNPRPGNTAQQSTQALEGDAVSFTDTLPDTVPGTSDTGPQQAQIRIINTVRGDTVEADVEIVNVPGFSGSHPVTLTFGQWYVINPTADIEMNPDPATQSDTAAESVTSPLLSASEPVPAVAAMAVRVDVLP